MGSDQLSFTKKLSYGVGHVLNDLSASMWFSYLLIYLHRIILFSSALSGYMMLIGQVADAVSTVFVGFESDRSKTGIFNYGKRKSWHLIGILSVLISFPFMFNLCPTCENSPEWARFLYYAPFVIIFQFGWASTQISHLAILPELTSDTNERTALNSIRYGFTVASNIFVYLLTYFLLKFKKSDGINNNGGNALDDDDDFDLGPGDASKFMYLTIIVCTVGIVFQILFHAGTKEKISQSDLEFQATHSSYANDKVKDWKGYLKSSCFYIIALMYLSTRLVVNMSQVYLTMYIADTLNLDKPSIALIPLICYISGFVSTFPIRYMTRFFGQYITYIIGICFIMAASALFWFNDTIYSLRVNAIFASVLLGVGSTVILVTSLSLTSDLIGKNTKSGAFVFGAMSFTDKLSNGIAVALLQQFSPCEFHTKSCDCRSYYHKIMGFLPSGCGLVATAALITLYILKRRRSQETITLISSEDQDEQPCTIQNYGSINTATTS